MPFGRPKAKTYTEDELYEYAVKALARRMRSVAEIKRALRQRVEADTELGQTLVEIVVRRLKDQGYLNDSQFARLLLVSPRQREVWPKTRDHKPQSQGRPRRGFGE